MTLPTQNPIPSNLKNDQLFNAEKIDEVVNSDDLQYTDRFGKKRFTFTGLYNIIQNWMGGISGLTGANNVGTLSGLSVQSELIGVQSVEALRSLEPTYTDQRVKVLRSSPTGVILNHDVYYDSSDKTSSDNGYSVFVTPNGNRWKTDITNGYNPLFLIGQEGYADISSAINKIAYDLAVRWGNNKGVIDFCTTIRIPGKLFGQTRYNVTGPIHIPSFVSLSMDVDTYFDYYTVTNTDGIIIDNSYFPMLLDSAYDPSTAARPRSVLLWEASREVFIGGRLILTHPIGSSRTSNTGITIGNTASGFIDVRGCNLNNFECFGFYFGIKINPIDVYINSFSRFHLGRNYNAVAVLGDTKTNAGEKFNFSNATISDSDSDLIYIENNGFELFFSDVSLDYPTGDLVKITKLGNAYVSFNQCHIEGVQGMLVNVTGSTLFPKYGKRIVFSNCMIDISSGQSTWNRTWFFSSTINTFVMVDKTTRFWPSTATLNSSKTAYHSLINNGSPANNAITLDYQLSDEDLIDASTFVLGQFKPVGVNKRVISTNSYSGTVGNAYTGGSSSTDSWGWYIVNGSWTYASADASDGDGLQAISLTSDDATKSFFVMCSLPWNTLPQEKFRALGAIKVYSGYTGSVNVSCLVEAHSLLTMNSTAVADNVIATTYSPAVDVAALAAANSRVGMFQGFCTQAAQVNSYSNSTHPLQFVRVGFKITGFTGTIELKLPTVTSHRLLTA